VIGRWTRRQGYPILPLIHEFVPQSAAGAIFMCPTTAEINNGMLAVSGYGTMGVIVPPITEIVRVDKIVAREYLRRQPQTRIFAR